MTERDPISTPALPGGLPYDATQIGFSQATLGAAGTVAAKLQQIVSVKDAPYNCVCDGVVDDTANFNLARTGALGKTLYISGTPLISSALTITSQEHWVFDGAVGTSLAGTPGSYLIKKSTLNADLVTISGGSASGTKIEGGGILGKAGNGGNGYVIATNGVELNSPWVALMGNDGIRVGTDAGVNANAFRIANPTCVSNVRRGIYVHDGSGNANGGSLVRPVCLNNGEDGIFFNKALINTIVAPLSETNTGIGLHFGPLSAYNVVLGGDVNEANTGGNLVLDSGQTNNYLLGTEYGTISQAAATDVGTGTTAAWIINRALAQIPTPLLAQSFAQISSAGSPYIRLDTRSANAAARNMALTTGLTVFGDAALRMSSALGGDPIASGTSIFYVSPSLDVAYIGGIAPGGFGAGTGSALSATSLRIVYGNAIPTAGTWAKGEIVKNQAPSVGNPKGWVCTVAGTPGTWVSEGNL